MINGSEDITRVINGITKLDINKMSFVDQMKYALCVAKFAEEMTPIVDKYTSKNEKERELFDELLQYFKDSDKEPHSTEIKPEDDEVNDAED